MRVIFEKVREAEGSSFACKSISRMGFVSPHHFHPEIEILQITQGSGHLVVGDHVGRFEPGDLMIFGSNLPHMLYSERPLEGVGAPTQLRYVQMRPEIYGGQFWDLSETKSLARLFSRSQRGIRFSLQQSKAVAPIFDELLEMQGLSRLASLLKILELLAGADDGQAMTSFGYAPVASQRSSERLDRTIRFINTQLTEDISVRDVAAVAGLSPQAFSRSFHQTVGISCMDYIVSLRIGLACRYLLETQETIATIAFKVGFKNLSNFNRLFKKNRAMTPSEYRSISAPDQRHRVDMSS